ncbi:MAG: hypothetical protein JJU45_07940 [Acidimicrobiia bacterium]|nr:hypothetical protein [Acidimicrobiia bacterium]
MVRKILVLGVALVAFSGCGGDDADDATPAAPNDVGADATEEQTPPPDDGAGPDDSDEDATNRSTGAAGPPCYEASPIIGPDGPEEFDSGALVMGNVPVEDVAGELETILEGFDGIACPEFPEGLGFGFGNSLLALDDDDVAIDAESDLYVNIDGDGDDPEAHADALMGVCEALSSYLADHDDAVGTARIEIDFGVEPGFSYEPAVLNEAVTPGDPGTCTAA